jgi:dethiobiotin synthetase
VKQSFPKHIFVSGIGTGVGKTIVSAILAEALQADYWKPVQCGGLDNSDSHIVKDLLSNPISKVHSETYTLKTASSPHYAARQENTEIQLSHFKIPGTNNRLVIEGAGGLMVPLNREHLVIDLIQHLNIPVILVAKNYLGGINHALLSIAILKSRKIELIGVIFNGPNYFDNEEVIQYFSDIPIIGRIDETKSITFEFISLQAERLKSYLSEYFKL